MTTAHRHPARSRPTSAMLGGLDGWDLSNSDPLPPDELTRQIALYKNEGSIEARNRVVESHLRLIAKASRKHSLPSSSFDDLMLEGSLALLRALDSFDPSRGVPFTSYACAVVEHTVRGASRGDRGVMRIPPRERRKAAIRFRAETTFFAQHGRNPNQDEWDTIRADSVGTDSVVSASSPTPPGIRTELADGALQDMVVQDRGPLPSEVVESHDTADRVKSALEALRADMREIVRLRFGLGGVPKLSIPEIAERLGQNPRSVDHMLRDAFRKLRSAMRPMDEEELVRRVAS